MKKFAMRWSALVLALALVLPGTALAAEEDALEKGAAEAAEAARIYGGAESIQYALWQDGEIVLTGHGGTYSRSENRALTEDILYGIGSVSKIYTTVALMQLAERGRVSLDAPVTRYLPDFRMADPRYRDITVRMLLNHSSGLPGSSMENAMLFGDSDRQAVDTLLETLSDQYLKADPGAFSVYCNDGFTLAQLVVERVSGLELMDYVERYILAPAGLEDTFAPGGDFDVRRLAKTYWGADVRALPQDCMNVVGTGGIYATASDLAAFGGALTGTTLLGQTSLEAMAAPEHARGIWPESGAPDALSYGLGWDCVEWMPFQQNGIQALVKGGDTLFYHAGLVVLPEQRMAAAVLTSGGVSTYNEMAAARMLVLALAGQGVTLDETVPALADAAPGAMPPELMEQAGFYATTSLQYAVTLTPEGTLTLEMPSLPSAPAQTFTYRTDGTFRDAATGQTMLRFETAANGQTYLYQQAVSRLPGLGALPVGNYAAVKLEETAISEEVQAAWDRYQAMSLVPMEERYCSQVYLALENGGQMEMPDISRLAPGYVGGSRILDAQTARCELQLPGTGGRDGQSFHVEDRDGVCWMEVNGSWYMDASAVPDLFTGGGWSYSTVGQEGYARWYQVGDCAGKTMSVQLPEGGGFWVYDGAGKVTASSVLWDDTTAQLPEDGLVVFAGDAGDRFHLRFQ